jgi:hypothetical protein
VRISERTFDLSELVVSDEQLSVRTPGIHASDIIRHIHKAMVPEKLGRFTEDDLDILAFIGRLWEAQIAKSVCRPPRYERIGEIEKDGIIMSPDSIDTIDPWLQEFKVTWRSARTPLESEFKWLAQIKAYCHALEMDRCTLYILYVCGTYTPPIPPIPRAWDLLFTATELRENWDMLLANKDAVQV